MWTSAKNLCSLSTTALSMPLRPIMKNWFTGVIEINVTNLAGVPYAVVGEVTKEPNVVIHNGGAQLCSAPVADLEVQLATYRQKMTEMAAQLGDSRRSSNRSASKASNNGEAPAKLAEVNQEVRPGMPARLFQLILEW